MTMRKAWIATLVVLVTLGIAYAADLGVFMRTDCSTLTPTTGKTVCFDQTENTWKIWNGSAWVEVQSGNLVLDSYTFASLPVTPATGAIALVTDENASLYLYDGAAWLSPMAQRIRETGGPTVLTMATLADAQFFERSGTNVVGRLGATVATPSTVMLRDASGRSQIVTPTVASDIANKSYVDNTSAIALPRSYLAGLGTSNGTDADHDIDVAVGTARDSANSSNITIATTTVKQIDASWAAGTNQGGLSSSLTVATDTWYHVHAVIISAAADVCIDTSVTAANCIADHSATDYRRIGSVFTGASDNILAFFQLEDEFLWKTVPALDVDTGTSGTSAVTFTATVPTGVKLLARLNALSSNGVVYISSLDVTDQAANPADTPIGSAGLSGAGQVEVLTNASAQARYRTNANDNLKIATYGWKDRRGRR
ncbi:MAG TPA: hypothetical protein ENH62_16290 [Marinobacter sp.]|uniref:Uncharacterized protein n=1 Tax=marine sediment metagenome TaxID=412755 RepID=A0A0F9NK38_9ZZZZ|nr:hypothetical protein [Marinobacter sp.]